MPARPGPALVVNPNSTQQLKAGDLTGFDRDEKGRITTSRSEIGRQHALQLLEDPEYRSALRRRMIAGTAGPVEVWIWRIGYGDPPRQREDDGGDAERFARAQEGVKKLMRENPELARAFAKAIAKGEIKEIPALVIGTPEEAAAEPGS